MAANRSVQKFGENISPSEGNFSPVKFTPIKKKGLKHNQVVSTTATLP